MTYHNAIKYITGAPARTGVSESLERISLLCERLGSPESRLPYIRFAGSNGKTVCQTMLASILAENGMKVGSLLMPAHSDPRENIIIDKKPLSIENTVKYVSIVSATVNALHEELATLANTVSDGHMSSLPESIVSGKISITPTKNEIIFLVALLAFRDAKCDICLIEGDHNGVDPTKFLAPPRTAVICGTIPEENTKETHRIRSYLTSGITEVISAPQDSETYKIISSACARINCRLSVPTRSMLEVNRLSLGGSEFTYRGEKYKLGVAGRFQIQNAITVIEVVRSLNRTGKDISYEELYRGLESLSEPTKFEAISVSPTIIIDSTHKTEAVPTMCDTLADFKEQIGTKLKLCITPDAPLISEYISCLCALDFEVTELILPIFDKTIMPDIEVNCPVTVVTTAKATAKKIISASKEEGLVLVTAPDDIAHKLRSETLKTLGF